MVFTTGVVLVVILAVCVSLTGTVRLVNVVLYVELVELVSWALTGCDARINIMDNAAITKTKCGLMSILDVSMLLKGLGLFKNLHMAVFKRRVRVKSRMILESIRFGHILSGRIS